MKKSDYVRRAVSELTGRPVKQSSFGFHLDTKYLIAAAGLLVVFVFGLIFWPRNKSEPKTSLATGGINCIFRVAEPDAPQPVTQGDATHIDSCVSMEVVNNNTGRILGLSNRESLNWNRGMLFDFEKPGKYCMWMKDMNFSLDMLWLDETGQIVAMRRDISPDTYPQSFCGPSAARYVIEVNAGVVNSGDLRLGQKLFLN